MKAFLRNWNGEIYVWKDVEYSDGKFSTATTGEIIEKTNIISLKDDNRNKFVRCSVCGKEFLRDSEEWYQHITKINDTSKCFTCRYLTEWSLSSSKTTYTMNECGRYEATRTYQTSLACRNVFGSPDIDSETARNSCYYNRCVGAEAAMVSDIFTEYPGVFDNMATIKQVLKCGYKEVDEGINTTKFRLKGKNNIYAVVNNLQIIDHFEVHYRNTKWTIYYSDKYQKYYTFQYTGNGTYNYVEWDRQHQLPTESFEYIKAKIASLYA